VNPIEVDARGLRCPLPVIRLARAARDAPAGTRIVVLADDPAARHDIPAWCRMRDHELCELTEVTGVPEVVTGVPELTEVPDSPGAGGPPVEGAHPAYLRFVVLVPPEPPATPQRSKAGGMGSESEDASRAT
jgi:tRNA 2-thiouridine synthesizing protein A